MTAVDAEISIDRGLPDEAALRAPQRYVVEGWTFGRSRLREVALTVGGRRFPAELTEVPRHDVKQAYCGQDPHGWALFSGFNIPVVLEPVTAGAVHSVSVEARFANGERLAKSLPDLRQLPWTPPPAVPIRAAAHSGALVAICMATFNPDTGAFRKQVEGIRAQTHRNWICIVSDDASDLDLRDEMRAILAADPRFVFVAHDDNVGFYRNFERALDLVPPRAEFVAFADQDDVWYPHKVATCLERFQPGTQLVFSDMRIVGRHGQVIAETYWTERRNHYRSDEIAFLALANTVTGAASVFRASLLDKALPFPPRDGDIYHDNWIALLAAGNGGIEYVDEPLYDYVQSGSNALGFRSASRGQSFLDAFGLNPRSLWWRNNIRSLPFLKKINALVALAVAKAGEFQSYRHVDLRSQFAVIHAALLRGVDSDADRRLRSLLSLRGALRLALRNRRARASVLQRDWQFVFTHAAQSLFAAMVPFLRLLARSGYFAQGHRTVQLLGVNAQANSEVAGLQRLLSRGSARIVDRSPVLNVLIAGIDPPNYFGGYIGMFNVAKRFAAGRWKVRLVLSEQDYKPEKEIREIAALDPPLRDFLLDCELVPFASPNSMLDVSVDDVFLATSMRNAHIASHLCRKTRSGRFIYFTQEFESIFYNHGAVRVVSDQSYQLHYVPLVSSGILREFYLKHGILPPSNPGYFVDNPVMRFPVSEARIQAGRRNRKKRLLFYARNQAHTTRNLYPLGCLAIDRAFALGYFQPGEWEILGIGADQWVQYLPSGATIRHIGKYGLDDYRHLLPQHDVGLSLMYSPHPSLMPQEMAAAGLLVVTNTYDVKTGDYFARISPNIDAVHPTVEQLADALIRACQRADDLPARVEGSRIRWPHTWDDALPDETIQAILDEVTAPLVPAARS